MKKYQNQARKNYLKRQKEKIEQRDQKNKMIKERRQKLEKYKKLSQSTSKRPKSAKVIKKPRWGVDLKILQKNIEKSDI